MTVAPITDIPFRGPFADGPPPDALRVDLPPIDTFGWPELRRMVVIYVVVLASVLRQIVLALPHPSRIPGAASAGVVDGFERLGPTFVKLGQLIASSPGLFPAPLADACQRCLDDVPPFPASVVHDAIEAELGRPVAELFASFDDEPLSAASVGQVHACVLLDGRDAVIKVQRPDIRDRMTVDLRMLYRFARAFERLTKLGRMAGAVNIVTDLFNVTFAELNPVREAWQQQRFRDNIDAFGDNAGVAAPEIYWDHCGPTLICMERMYGVPMDAFEEIRARGIDAETLLRRGVKVWMEAAVAHGPFHGDVHAGNLWVLDDGRVTFLDFGIIGELPDLWRDVMRDLMYTAGIDSDYARVARAFKRVGIIDDDAGTDAEVGMRLQLVFGPMLDFGVAEVSLGELLKLSLELAKQFDVSAPEEMVLLGKQLLYFERYAKELAPDWVLARDLYLIRNIFPEEVGAKAGDLGLTFPD